LIGVLATAAAGALSQIFLLFITGRQIKSQQKIMRSQVRANGQLARMDTLRSLLANVSSASMQLRNLIDERIEAARKEAIKLRKEFEQGPKTPELLQSLERRREEILEAAGLSEETREPINTIQKMGLQARLYLLGDSPAEADLAEAVLALPSAAADRTVGHEERWDSALKDFETKAKVVLRTDWSQATADT